MAAGSSWLEISFNSRLTVAISASSCAFTSRRPSQIASAPGRKPGSGCPAMASSARSASGDSFRALLPDAFTVVAGTRSSALATLRDASRSRRPSTEQRSIRPNSWNIAGMSAPSRLPGGSPAPSMKAAVNDVSARVGTAAMAAFGLAASKGPSGLTASAPMSGDASQSSGSTVLTTGMRMTVDNGDPPSDCCAKDENASAPTAVASPVAPSAWGSGGPSHAARTGARPAPNPACGTLSIHASGT